MTNDAASTKSVTMIYGTAWKGESTADCVKMAIEAGFRSIDTAAQPKHYREDLVGEGIRSCIENGLVRREDLHIQSKFTPLSGQDESNLPYEPSATIANQVNASISSSLLNLRPRQSVDSLPHSFIDCMILHAPLPTLASTLEAWSALSAFVPTSIRTLGISNITLRPLLALCGKTDIPPLVVQNRFHAESNYDSLIRSLCRERGMTYQGFWVLSKNEALMSSAVVTRLAKEAGVERQAALYSLMIALGNTTALNGTRKADTMRRDLEGLHRIQEWATRERNSEEWDDLMNGFKRLVGDI